MSGGNYHLKGKKWRRRSHIALILATEASLPLPPKPDRCPECGVIPTIRHICLPMGSIYPKPNIPDYVEYRDIYGGWFKWGIWKLFHPHWDTLYVHGTNRHRVRQIDALRAEEEDPDKW